MLILLYTTITFYYFTCAHIFWCKVNLDETSKKAKRIRAAIGSLLETEEIRENQFEQYCDAFDTDDPKASATRGLAIWHPDRFFCFNGANKQQLRKILYPSRDKELTWKDYPQILKDIYEMNWYKQAQTYEPTNEIERLCKKYCVALIDCIIYRRKDKQQMKSVRQQ